MATIEGTSRGETLSGTVEDDVLIGYGGDDALIGGGGDNTLIGGAGNDFMTSESGGTAVFSGSSFDYEIQYTLASHQFHIRDSVAGRDGDDKAAVAHLQFSNTSLDAAAYYTETAIQGSSNGENIVGSALAEPIHALGGSDTISAGEGGDRITAGEGNDLVQGGAGDDEIYDEEGDDTVHAGMGNDTIAGGIGTNHFDGGDGVDAVWFYDSLSAFTQGVIVDLVAGTATNPLFTDAFVSIEDLTTTVFADIVTGNDVANFVSAGGGPDSVFGAGGNDLLLGGSGTDTLSGGEGNDALNGGTGNDILSGGNGIDKASFSGAASLYTTTHSESGWTVSKIGAEDSDVLSAIERIHFTGFDLAIDLDGHAGSAARILGALLGPQSLENPDYVGIGLSLFDAGYTELQVAALAIGVVYGAQSDEAFVTQLFENIVHVTPDAFYLDQLTGLLSGGMSRAELLVAGANTIYNDSSIDFFGLSQTGIAFLQY